MRNELFTQTLVESSHAVGRRKPAAVLMVLMGESAVVAALAVAPLLMAGVLPVRAMVSYLAAPPAPTAVPPPPAAPARLVRRLSVSEFNRAGALIAPPAIPADIAIIEEAAPPTVPALTAAPPLELTAMPPLPAAPPPAPPAPAPVAVGGEVEAASCLSCPAPSYPETARQARIQGVVTLSAIISEDGTIQQLRLVSGHPLLAPAALNTVRGWRYRPLVLDGHPLPVETTIRISFSLGS